MSFLERAKQAAEQARHAAGETAREVAEKARAEAPGAAEKAREAAGKARHTLVTAIERIHPGLLLGAVIKATARRERANAAPRALAPSQDAVGDLDPSGPEREEG